jgi:hypothetical protein
MLILITCGGWLAVSSITTKTLPVVDSIKQSHSNRSEPQIEPPPNDYRPRSRPLVSPPDPDQLARDETRSIIARKFPSASLDFRLKAERHKLDRNLIIVSGTITLNQSKPYGIITVYDEGASRITECTVFDENLAVIPGITW